MGLLTLLGHRPALAFDLDLQRVAGFPTGNLAHVAVAGSYAYLADDTDGLHVLDIIDPTHPQQVGFYKAPMASLVEVAGDYAYLVTFLSDLQLIDISSPARPKRVGTYSTRTSIQAIKVSGRIAYVGISQGLFVVDVRTHLELKEARDVILRYTGELRRLNDEKNEFMGIVAHDLRNPLGAINGFAEIILEETQSPQVPSAEQWPRLRDEVLHSADRIKETSTRMTVMVQNLLDANRIERGEFHLNLRPTELGALMRAVVESQRPRAAAKQQTIQIENDAGPGTVQADPDVMHQVLENLLSNAVKYSPPGKGIRVRLKTSPGTVRCEVQDEGPGLSAEDQKKLFGKFARLSTKPTGGEHATGLGLSIVKKMAEAMNGQVSCQSELNRGATFVVQFPT